MMLVLNDMSEYLEYDAEKANRFILRFLSKSKNTSLRFLGKDFLTSRSVMCLSSFFITFPIFSLGVELNRVL